MGIRRWLAGQREQRRFNRQYPLIQRLEDFRSNEAQILLGRSRMLLSIDQIPGHVFTFNEMLVEYAQRMGTEPFPPYMVLARFHQDPVDEEGVPADPFAGTLDPHISTSTLESPVSPTSGEQPFGQEELVATLLVYHEFVARHGTSHPGFSIHGPKIVGCPRGIYERGEDYEVLEAYDISFKPERQVFDPERYVKVTQVPRTTVLDELETTRNALDVYLEHAYPS